MNSLYYVPSGRLPARAVWLTLHCTAVVIPAAWLYAWLTIHLPLILNAAALLGFALGLGLATRYAARRGRARNPAWMGRLGLLLGLIGWYAQEAAWIALLEADAVSASPAWSLANFVAVLTDPLHIAQVAADLYEAGAYSIGGMRVRGIVLMAIWATELILLLGLPHAIGRMSASEPFCEQSDTWMEEIELPRKFEAISQPATLVALLESEPAQLFRALEQHPQEDPAHYAVLILYRGAGEPIVSIRNVEVRNDGQKEKEVTRPVLVQLRLPDIDPHKVLRHGGGEGSDAANTVIGTLTADPPELAGAIAHLQAERFDAALAAALPHINATRKTLRIDALRLCALSGARLGRWDDSLHYWRLLFDDEGTAHNALNVGTSCTMSGDPVHGREWIARARVLNATSREMPDMQIVTNFITALTRSGQMALALPYLDEIRAVYIGLRNTDPSFLHTRQLPFFSVFLEHSAPVVRAVLGSEQSEAWYASMLPCLDQRGRNELTAWMGQQELSSEPAAM